ncbi:hypothetical protein [Paenibacillus sp. 481]|uniref:hypothetical protein n=1 Tax=Paenibacillus sp. 481 TaxID=2835869 RepID=UPI001E6124DC|nr:hypothetical protein [Paenibacillus sp. 481]UHA73472.1 hypothetical protein KIK04_23440 [Paenibacillus sp. 481]
MEDKNTQLLLNLRRIKQSGYQLQQEESAMDYVELMLEYIGDPSPELRDELIYMTFCKWIVEKEYIQEDELRYILSVLIEEGYGDDK